MQQNLVDPLTVANVLKVREIVLSIGRYIIRDFAKIVGISQIRLYFILKHILKVLKLFAEWIPQILTDENNRLRLQTAKQIQSKTIHTYS